MYTSSRHFSDLRVNDELEHEAQSRDDEELSFLTSPKPLVQQHSLKLLTSISVMALGS